MSENRPIRRACRRLDPPTFPVDVALRALLALLVFAGGVSMSVAAAPEAPPAAPAAAASASGGDLLARLPADTVAALVFHGVARLGAAWAASPGGRALKDPRLAPVATLVREETNRRKREFLTKWGVETEDLLRLLVGDVAVFVTHFEWTTPDIYEFDVCLIAEIRPEDEARARRLVETFFEKAPVDARRSRYTFRETVVHSIQFPQGTVASDAEAPRAPARVDPRTGRTRDRTPAPDSAQARIDDSLLVFQYAVAGRFLIVAEGRHEPIRKILAALEDPARGLGATTAYRALRNDAPPPSPNDIVLTAWSDAERLMRNLLAFARPTRDEDPVPFASFGLDKLGAVRARLRLGGEALEFEADVLLDEAFPRAALPFPPPGASNPCHTAALASSETSSYLSVLFDGPRAWAGFQALAKETIPHLWRLVETQLDPAARMFGIDIERGVVGALGGEFALLHRPLPPSPGARAETAHRRTPESNTLLVGLRDGRTFADNHRRLFEGLVREPFQIPIEQTNYLDFPIWNLRGDPARPTPATPGWSLTDGYLILTDAREEIPGLLRATVGRSALSLADDPVFRATLDDQPAEGRLAFLYHAPRSSPEVLFDSLRWFALRFGANWTRSGAEAARAEIQQALGRYFGPTSAALHGDARSMRLRLRHHAVGFPRPKTGGSTP